MSIFKHKFTTKAKVITVICVLVIVLAAIGAVLFFWRNSQSDSTNQATADSGEILKYNTASDVKFSSKKMNVYLFWGKGCPHCKAMSEFLKTLRPNYSKYYNLYTFEVWYNSDNADLLNRVAGKMNHTGDTGVPFLVIGDKVFVGYQDKMDDEIKTTVVEQYNKNNRYDVFREL